MNIDQAYLRCEEITTTQARNFSYGIKLLPTAKRQAMSAIYALARRIDDIGDGDRPAPDKMAALADTRKEVAALTGHDPYDGDDPVLVAVADVARRFPVPLSAFDDLIDGCEMDVHGERYRTFDDLVGYCRRVAGSIGRLSLGGLRHPQPRTVPAARRRPRGGPAGHQHPPGHHRGPRPDGPGVPARRGSGAKLPRGLPTSAETSTRSRPSISLRSRPARRGTASSEGWPCCPCSTGGRGRAPQPWPVSTVDFWSGSSATPPGCCVGRLSLAGRRAKAAVAVRAPARGQRRGRRRRRRGPGIQWSSAAAWRGWPPPWRGADRAPRVDAARVPQPARRSLTWSFQHGGPLDRQRAARVPSMLRGVPLVPRAGSGARVRGRAARPPGPARGGGPGETDPRRAAPDRPLRSACALPPAPLHLAEGRSCATRTCRSPGPRSRLGTGLMLALRRLDPRTIRRSTLSRSGPGWPGTGSPPGAA